jgi:hypothetical protein
MDEELTRAVADNQAQLDRSWHYGYSVHRSAAVPLKPEHLRAIFDHLDRNIASINAGSIADHARKNDGAVPQCGLNCHHCCFQTIEVSTLELVRIVAWADADEAARLLARSRDIAPKVARLDKPARYQAGIPCPALKGRACGIYAVRPVACQTYLSLSRSACDRDWARRGQTRKDHWTDIPLLAIPQLAGHSILTGLHAGLHRVGLEVERVELAAGLAHALAVPDLVPRWLAGERLFQAVALRAPIAYPDMLDQMIRRMAPEQSKLSAALDAMFEPVAP